MKLWHDDVRPPPDGWVWARTNQQAMMLLCELDFDECSLDHDLGLHDLKPEDFEDWDEIIRISNALKPNEGETGLDLVNWMVENGLVPAKVTIHSWNPDGAARMATRLVNAGYDCYLAPFKP